MPKSRRHILLVEEHRDIRIAFVALFETVYDFALDVAIGARDALGITGRQDVDVAVVDLANGAELNARLAMIRAWRRGGLVFPVIATSVYDTDDLVVATFEAGGDDFIRKPYVFSEMRARIQGQLARHLNAASRTTRIDGIVLPAQAFAFAGATITPDLRIAFPDGRTAKLGPKHFGMLRKFSENAGNLLLKEDLIYSVWGADANTNSASVHQYLHVLRKLYRASGIDLSSFVCSESKVGWRIVAYHQ